MSNARAVFTVASKLIENVASEGGVDAVIQDMKANYGVTISREVAASCMVCGATVVLLTMQQAIKEGALRMDFERTSELLGKPVEEAVRERYGAEFAPKSEAQLADEKLSLAAERAANEALERIRKLH